MEFLIQGGVVLIPILILSVGGVAVILERFLFFFRIKEKKPDLTDYIIFQLRNGFKETVLQELKKKNSPEAQLILAGIETENLEVEQISLKMESQALKSLTDLEKNVPYLSSIANISTLLGLLGTVTGMIISFLNIKLSGVSDPAVLAGGISQALVTTAAGLSVAIPCLLFYHVYTQVINRLASRMEITTSELLAFITERER